MLLLFLGHKIPRISATIAGCYLPQHMYIVSLVQLMFGFSYSRQVVLQFYEHEFVELACQCPAVVVCRCSPTQKADIVQLLKVHTDKATCAIGTSLWCLAIRLGKFTYRNVPKRSSLYSLFLTSPNSLAWQYKEYNI